MSPANAAPTPEAAPALIAQLDKLVLEPLHHELRTVRSNADRVKWTQQVNKALDERLRLMKLRDSAPIPDIT